MEITTRAPRKKQPEPTPPLDAELIAARRALLPILEGIRTGSLAASWAETYLLEGAATVLGEIFEENWMQAVDEEDRIAEGARAGARTD